MSGSLSTELSYESLRDPPERDTSSTPDERSPAQAAELLELQPDFHAPDTTPDPQPDNRLSLVSGVSLEPRRRSRHHHNHHHHSRHSHLHRELAHMLSVSSRDAKELRRGLGAAFDKLDQSRVRASHAEKLALDMLLRVREAEQERANAMRQSSTVREELGKYKALLDNAHGEIQRAQQMLQDQEQLRYEAESTAARARDNARLMKQRRLVDLAREQGRKIGYNEGIQAGQRFGYEGRSPTEDEGLHQNEGARFREMFDESRYRLDEFDQSPPFRDAYLNHDTDVLPTPLPRRQVYPRLQGQLDGPGSAIDTNNMASEAPYTPTSPVGVQRTSSADSSSTTTLPAAPAYQHVSSRAPPPMPTIPEVPSTEMGSGSWRSKSLRGSPRTQSHIQPALSPQASTNADILPSVVPFPQGGAFEPPPGLVADTPSGFAGGNLPHSDAQFYESPSPHRAFDNPSVLNNGMIPDVSRSPAREHFEASPEDFRSPARGQFGAFPEATHSPARGQFEQMPGAFQSPAREHFETSPGAIPSPVQERFSTNYPPGATRARPDSVRFVEDPRNSESSTRPSSRQGVPPPRRDGPPRQHPTPQMPAPLAPQSSADASYAYGPHGTAQRGRPSESYNRVPRDASRNAASNPAPNFAPQSGADASYAYGPHGAAQRGGPSESYNRVPRDASRNIASNPAPNFVPQSSANASYAYGPDGTAQRGRPSEPYNRVPRDASRNAASNPAPNFAPQSSANAPGAYGSQSTAQRGRRPSESYNRMQPDASSNAPSNPASNFVPQSSAPYAYESHGMAQRGRPSESDNRMPRDAGFNAPSNSSSNLYTRSSQIIPNSVERPTDRAQERARGMSPRISGEQLPDPGAAHDPRRTMAPPAFTGDSSAGRPRTPQDAPPSVHIQIPPTRYYTPSSASPHLTTPPTTGNPHGSMYSSGATSPNPNVRVSSSPNRSPVRFPPTLYNEPNLQRQSTPGVDYERERRVSTPVLPIPSRDRRAASPGGVHSPSDFFSGSSYTARPRSGVTSPHTPTDTLPVRAPSVSPRPTSAAFAQPIPPPQGAVTPRRTASPNPLPRGASPAPLFRASSPAPLPIRSPSAQSTRIHRSTSDVSLPGAPGSPYMRYNPNLEADIAVLASSSLDKI